MAVRLLYLLVPAVLAATAKNDTCTRRGCIIGGQPAAVGQFPHQAYVEGDGYNICGGSLIASNKVLTAAHCTVGFKMYTIRLGGIQRYGYEATAWTDTNVWSMAHPEYDSEFLNNDVAIVFLWYTPPINSFINVVELPSSLDVDDSFAGRNVLLSGWGLTSKTEEWPNRLQWTELKVITNEVCSTSFKPGWVIDSTLCAIGDNSGVCSGDSGGPLVLKTRSGYKQIGVFSFLLLPCDIEVPAGFVRLTSFFDWVRRMKDDRV